MAGYLIGEVEEITGVKAHVLRYWEEVIPGIAPKKDLGGRRVYSSRDIQTIMRLKFLIQEKKFTIEGARSELIAESDLYANAAYEATSALETITEIRSSSVIVEGSPVVPHTIIASVCPSICISTNASNAS